MRKEALVPLTGLLFIALLFASFAVAGEPPEASEDVGEIVDHYADNKDAIIVSSFLFSGAAVSLVFFGGYLRRVLGDAAGPGSILPGLVLTGASIVAVGGAIDATISLSLAEAADDIEPAAVQALQALWDNDFIPIAVGMLIFLISAGISVVRSGALPKWLGWAAIVLAVIGFTPIGFVAFLGTALWILIVSVMLAVRGRPTSVA
jgi:hypothetical protein